MLMLVICRPSLKFEYVKSYPSYISSFYRTCGWIIHRRSLGSRRCWTTASRMILYQESLSCAGILQANPLHMVMDEMCSDTRVGFLASELTFIQEWYIADNFDALADLIATYPLITRSTHFVFIPGPLDITVNSTFPRKPLLSTLTGRLKTRIPKVHFATNPCRIKFFNQEVVVFREDLLARMLRNVVGVKHDVKSEDLKRFVRCLWLSNDHLFIHSCSLFNQSSIKAICVHWSVVSSQSCQITIIVFDSIHYLQQWVENIFERWSSLSWIVGSCRQIWCLQSNLYRMPCF